MIRLYQSTANMTLCGERRRFSFKDQRSVLWLCLSSFFGADVVAVGLSAGPG